MDLAAIKVYRITHIDNIEHVLQNGITHKNSPNHNPHYKSIGLGTYFANEYCCGLDFFVTFLHQPVPKKLRDKKVNRI